MGCVGRGRVFNPGPIKFKVGFWIGQIIDPSLSTWPNTQKCMPCDYAIMVYHHPIQQMTLNKGMKIERTTWLYLIHHLCFNLSD